MWFYSVHVSEHFYNISMLSHLHMDESYRRYRMVRRFRVRGKKFLLTWPQANGLDFQDIWKVIKANGEFTYCVVSKEDHQDEGIHYHAAVFYVGELYSTDNCWCIHWDSPSDTDLDKEWRCNVQSIGNSNADKERSIAYVKKDGNWQEEGERPCITKKMDRRRKIEFVQEHSYKECILSGEFSFSELAKIPALKAELMQHRDNRERIVMWFHGETGSGKTKRAWELALESYDMDDIWIGTGNLRDFKNGYKGQRCVILDDFRNGDIKFNELLALTDRYPCYVNVKGSYVPWKADLIIITSPDPPQDVFLKTNKYTGEVIVREDIGQLLRRINSTQEFHIP